MTNRPILFSGPMVRALLDGRKTQTRRIAKFVHAAPDGSFHLRNSAGGILGVTEDKIPIYGPDYAPHAIGDRLWVREALDMGFAGGFPICTCTYAADGASVDLRPSPFWAGDQKRNCIPSIHMPRWASRLTLVVTDVRVQRLQDINEADVIDEGMRADLPKNISFTGRMISSPITWSDGQDYTAHAAFRRLWNSINGPGTWDANPWVCAVTFTVHRVNIDKMER